MTTMTKNRLYRALEEEMQHHHSKKLPSGAVCRRFGSEFHLQFSWGGEMIVRADDKNL